MIMAGHRPGRSVASGATGDVGDPRRQTRTRSLAQQRATWLDEAAAVPDGLEAVASMVQTALTPPAETARIADARWVTETADHVLTVMEDSRSTWQMGQVRAEAQPTRGSRSAGS
jgi:hypothetical protein